MKAMTKMMIGIVSLLFTLTVSSLPSFAAGTVNHAPRFVLQNRTLEQSSYAFEGEAITFSALARDADNDPLTYTDEFGLLVLTTDEYGNQYDQFIETPLPAGAVLDPVTRIFTWTPTASEVGTRYSLRSEVSDGRGGEDDISINFEVLGNMPAVDLSAYLPPVGNQGQTGSCAAWAVAYYYKTLQEASPLQHNWIDVKTNTSHQFSPGFTYSQVSHQGGGSTEGDNYWIIIQQGCAPLSAMPSTGTMTQTPTFSQYEAALPFRAESAEVLWSLTELRQRLAQGDAFVIGIPVYPDLLGKGSGIYNRGYSYDYLGYHALAVVGYNDSLKYADGKMRGAFKVVNSWGSNWGNHGYFWISYNTILAGGVGCTGMTDRTGEYQPKAVAYLSLKPSNRRMDNSLYVRLGINDLTEFLFRDFLPSGLASGVVDVSDYLQYLPPSSANKWYLEVTDQMAVRTESIGNFSIKYRLLDTDAQQEYVANNLPVAISGPGATTYAYITGETSPNQVPTRPTVTFQPQNPTCRDTVVATITDSTDADGDPIAYRYRWYRKRPWLAKRGFGFEHWEFLNNEGNTVSLPDVRECSRGDLLKYVVIPFDGKADGPAGEAQGVIANSLPLLYGADNASINENQTVHYYLNAYDSDCEDFWYNLKYSAIGLPKGAKFTCSNKYPFSANFTWTPTLKQAGTYPITFKVTDGAKAWDSSNVTITVYNVNQKPSLSPIPKKAVKENKLLKFKLVAKDPDFDVQDTLTYSANIASAGATGAQINSTSGEFNWTPTVGLARTAPYQITFTATDKEGLSDSKNANITVGR